MNIIFSSNYFSADLSGLPPFVDFPDVYIALALLIIVGIAFLIYRIEVLPRKSLAFIISSFLAAFGIHLLVNVRKKGLRKKLEADQAALVKKEKEVFESFKDNLGVSESELQGIRAEVYKDRDATAKALLLLEATGEVEKNRISKLIGEELDKEITETLKK